jgi:Peptidase family M1 domain
LAWERGHGWAKDPAVDLFGEMATSEEFRLEALEVVTQAGEEVLGAGELVERVPGPGSTTVSRFRADSVRDVAVTVGELRLVERSVNGVRLHVGGLATGAVPLERWADRTAEAMRKLANLLGPCMYTDLWVTIVPSVPTGIEFPSAIQFADVDPDRFQALVSHEVAHMWFYGLVGNSQSQHPWLDESFATWAQAVVDRDEGSYQLAQVPADLAGLVGKPMAFWARQGEGYGRGVYLQGGAALIAARRAVGTARFDQAVRSYIDVNAHQIATPDDVERAFAGLPEALEILRRVGALS